MKRWCLWYCLHHWLVINLALAPRVLHASWQQCLLLHKSLIPPCFFRDFPPLDYTCSITSSITSSAILLAPLFPVTLACAGLSILASPAGAESDQRFGQPRTANPNLGFRQVRSRPISGQGICHAQHGHYGGWLQNTGTALH